MAAFFFSPDPRAFYELRRKLEDATRNANVIEFAFWQLLKHVEKTMPDDADNITLLKHAWGIIVAESGGHEPSLFFGWLEKKNPDYAELKGVESMILRWSNREKVDAEFRPLQVYLKDVVSSNNVQLCRERFGEVTQFLQSWISTHPQYGPDCYATPYEQEDGGESYLRIRRRSSRSP